jgi:DNA-binding winged helix-turn-helix (wHTH) protein
MLWYVLNGGGNISRVLIIESNEGSHSIIDEIIKTLKKHPEFELLWLKHEPVLSLPGLEIDPDHRKVYCDKLEINLTAKEYNLLCLFVANKGHVFTYDQIYRKVWEEEAFGNANNAIACHVHNLREKIGRLLPEGCFVIRCVREVGYCFETDSECIAAT